MKLKYVILLFSLLAVSCSKKFDLAVHYDPTLPFEIIHRTLSDDHKSVSDVLIYQINQSDTRHSKLVSWLKSNNNGWKKTDHDTHAGLISVNQNDFTILLYPDNDMVVIGIDVEGNDMKQFKRDMDSNELMFIVDD